MQRRSDTSTTANQHHAECTFCQRATINDYILHESAHFRIVADHAPLVEGHLLLITKEHYACFGEVPTELDTELAQLKQKVQSFFSQWYASPLYWEHGVFHQSVFHAHLHCLPFGHLTYQEDGHSAGQIIRDQHDIRTWYQKSGHYFFMQDAQHGYIFPPDIETYSHIVKQVMAPSITARGIHPLRHSPEQRRIEGKPLIAALSKHWQQFKSQSLSA